MCKFDHCPDSQRGILLVIFQKRIIFLCFQSLDSDASVPDLNVLKHLFLWAFKHCLFNSDLKIPNKLFSETGSLFFLKQLTVILQRLHSCRLIDLRLFIGNLQISHHSNFLVVVYIPWSPKILDLSESHVLSPG